MEQKTTEQIKQAIADQLALCNERNVPDFAPGDGRCYDCGKNVYQNYERQGYNGKSHVTGCPHCNRSFCD